MRGRGGRRLEGYRHRAVTKPWQSQLPPRVPLVSCAQGPQEGPKAPSFQKGARSCLRTRTSLPHRPHTPQG